MMRLFTAGPSPFGRKVVLALHVTGLQDQVDIIATNTAEPDSENRRLNPLGKIPTLVTDEGPLFDSRYFSSNRQICWREQASACRWA